MKKITEGSAEISVPAMSLRRKSEAFYNPAMGYQRDITMSALRIYSSVIGSGIDACDPLAGTGIRSVRMAAEVPGISSIAANDKNPAAFRIMKKNLSGLGVPLSLSGIDANLLFLENQRRFNFIDIDPFGSPVGFLFNSGAALRPRSMLCLTATDTGALCGTFPSRCLARYGVRAVKTDFFKETGLRVLITSAMIELSRHGIALEPLYSHANHYFRVILRARRTRSGLTKQFRNVGFLSYCPACLWRSMKTSPECPSCGRKTELMGPLWSGSLKDSAFCGKMLEDMKSSGYKHTGELETSVSENDHPFYYDIHRVFKSLNVPPKKTCNVIERLINAGHEASRTSLTHMGIRTDAPHDAVLDAVV